ncbi:MAG TPA: DUF6438 domain-containing protein [Sphingomonas sp.]
MRTRLNVVAAGLVGLMALSACTTGNRGFGGGMPPPRFERIKVDVGPCFGFCPVYVATFEADGTVRFEGVRQTAELGEKVGQVSPEALDAIASDLESYRPAVPGQPEECETQVSDQQKVMVTWAGGPDGGWTREHDRGCMSPERDALEGALGRAMERSGVAAWARQVTRPGASRG